MGYGAWFTLFIMAFVSVMVLLAYLGYPDEHELMLVMDAIEKTYPNSMFQNIQTHIEMHNKETGAKKWALAKIYSILEILEMEEVVTTFEQDIGVDEHGNRKPYICWMIIGRWNKDKKNRSKDWHANLLGEAI